MTPQSKEPDVAKTLEEYLNLPYRLEVTPSEHGGYVVRYPELLGCVTQVERAEDVMPMAREILAGWLEIAIEDGQDIPLPEQPERFSGRFVVRIPRSLHRALAEAARREGVSLNAYVASLLAAGQAQSAMSRQLDDLCAGVESLRAHLQRSSEVVPKLVAAK